MFFLDSTMTPELPHVMPRTCSVTSQMIWTARVVRSIFFSLPSETTAIAWPSDDHAAEAGLSVPASFSADSDPMERTHSATFSPGAAPIYAMCRPSGDTDGTET